MGERNARLRAARERLPSPRVPGAHMSTASDEPRWLRGLDGAELVGTIGAGIAISLDTMLGRHPVRWST